MKTNFFKALLGTCSGVAVFERLRCQHGFRTFWHLLLMNLLCGIIIGIGIYPDWSAKSARAVDLIVENCGELKIDSSGITPGKEPDKVKSFVIAGPMSVTYLPPEEKALPENFEQGCGSGVLWSGAHIGFWQKKGENSYIFTSASTLSGAEQGQEVPTEKMVEVLRSSHPVKLNENDVQVFTGSRLMALCRIMLIIAVISISVVNLVQIIIYIAMFAGVFALMGINRPRRFKVFEMVKLAVYAGFPAMLIGSVAVALNLPLLDFNMTYVLGMTIYLMVVMNRLERWRQEREWQVNKSSDNDRMA